VDLAVTRPTDTHKDGRETISPRISASFRSFSSSSLRADLLGQPLNGRYRSLASTASTPLRPAKVLAEENRYVSISGLRRPLLRRARLL